MEGTVDEDVFPYIAMERCMEEREKGRKKNGDTGGRGRERWKKTLLI